MRDKECPGVASRAMRASPRRGVTITIAPGTTEWRGAWWCS